MGNSPHRTGKRHQFTRCEKRIRHYEHGEALNSWNPLSNGFLRPGKEWRVKAQARETLVDMLL